MSRSLFATLHDRFARPAILRAQGLSRREFLRRSLAAAALSGIATSRSFARAPREDVSVLVLGAGIAGMYACQRLQEAGLIAVCVDARGRSGGRLRSVTDLVPGQVIDAGGEFIGSVHPRWATLARRLRLRLVDAGGDDALDSPIVIDGQMLPPSQAEELHEQMAAALASLTDLARDIDPNQPWTHPRAAALDATSMEDWLRSLDASPRCKAALAAQFTGDYGVDPHRQSLLAVLAMVRGGGLERFWTDSELFRCEGGAARLAERLHQTLGDMSFQLGTTVEAVIPDEGGFRLKTNRQFPLRCTHLVVALPPSAWGDVRFEFDLPQVRTPVQMSSSVKWISAVKRAFWKDAGLAAEGLAAGRPLTPQFTWSPAANDRDGPAALTALAGGTPAEELSRLDESARDAALRRAVGAVLPGLDENMIRSIYLDWPAEPHIRGGFGAPAPCQTTTLLPALREPPGPVYFAGDWCSPAFMGYMEGALESAEHAASVLVRHVTAAERQ